MATPINTPIPTHSGWKLAGDIQIGDILFTPYSNYAEVTRVQKYKPSEMYEVMFDDGLTVECDKHTKLQIQTREQRNNVTKAENRRDRKHKFGARTTYRKLTVPELYDSYLRPDGRLEYSVLNSQAVPFPSKDLPVPPYLFSIWMSIKTEKNNLWVNNLPIEKIKKVARSYGHAIVTRKHKNGRMYFDIRPSIKDSFLFAGKDYPSNIPIMYVESSISQRQEYIEGLIDSQKVWFDKHTSCYVLQDRDFRYVKRLQGMLESLGYKTMLLKYKNATNYRLKFKIYDNPRKNRRLISKITKIAPKECIHIETGEQFLVGEGFIPIC